MSAERVATLDAVLREAARIEIMPRFRRLGAGSIRTKSGPHDLVTDADEAAECFIASRLRDLLPGALIVGEEASAVTPALAGAIGDAAIAITIDPIDGTSNYAAGLPVFGVMAAIIEDGVTTAAVIHDPVGGDSLCAVRGAGAWLAAEPGCRTRPLRVAPPAPLAQMTGAVSWRYLPPAQRASACLGMQRFASVFSLRCAAAEYRMAADGQCDVLLYNRLMPWDHAPGALIVTEAGGVALGFDGTPYAPTRTTGGLICTADLPSFDVIRAALLEPSA